MLFLTIQLFFFFLQCKENIDFLTIVFKGIEKPQAYAKTDMKTCFTDLKREKTKLAQNKATSRNPCRTI